ncbi:MAG: MFS transporter, partial [Actinomycetia bacterium]|nr:MFS transporter [Actinomycetes bacterium]
MTTTESRSGLSTSQLWWLVGGLCLGLFLSSTEQSVVATALPTMAGELGAANRLAWVVSAYLLTSTIVTPLYGKMSDLFGRRIVYQVSIIVFLFGSILCALAQTMNQLVIFRAVQGLGGGGLMSLAFVIIGDVVSPRERGRYIGIFTMVFTISAVTGPLWGGSTYPWDSWQILATTGVGVVGSALFVWQEGR